MGGGDELMRRIVGDLELNFGVAIFDTAREVMLDYDMSVMDVRYVVACKWESIGAGKGNGWCLV